MVSLLLTWNNEKIMEKRTPNFSLIKLEPGRAELGVACGSLVLKTSESTLELELNKWFVARFFSDRAINKWATSQVLFFITQLATSRTRRNASFSKQESHEQANTRIWTKIVAYILLIFAPSLSESQAANFFTIPT